MKAKALVTLLVASCSLATVRAQNVMVAAGVTVTPAAVQTTAGAPAPAVCPSPGLCPAPVSYPMPVACGTPWYPYVGYTPNVVYFGGPYSYMRNYYNGNAAYCWPYSSVVSFGRGEAYERGYYFHRWR